MLVTPCCPVVLQPKPCQSKTDFRTSIQRHDLNPNHWTGVPDWNCNGTIAVRRLFSATDQNGPAWSLYWNRYVTAAPIGPLQNSKFKLDI